MKCNDPIDRDHWCMHTYRLNDVLMRLCIPTTLFPLCLIVFFHASSNMFLKMRSCIGNCRRLDSARPCKFLAKNWQMLRLSSSPVSSLHCPCPTCVWIPHYWIAMELDQMRCLAKSLSSKYLRATAPQNRAQCFPRAQRVISRWLLQTLILRFTFDTAGNIRMSLFNQWWTRSRHQSH